jgi:predicted aspartyl protease
MRLKIKQDKPITLFVRIKGRKGIRELRAVLDLGSEYSIIPLQDAVKLGNIKFWNPDPEPTELTKAVTNACTIDGYEIVLEEISVADVTAKNVKAIAHDIPRLTGVEAVLGLSFLNNFKTTIDYGKGYLTIEPAPKPGTSEI